jgi:predicted nucleic acid-binding protein
MKIVLDTNILVRANARARGPARELLQVIASSPEHTLLLSAFLLQELERVFSYERVRVSSSTRANASTANAGDASLTEADVRKHLRTLRLVQMYLVAARIFPVACERLRRCRRCCRAVGAKLVSLRGPDGSQSALYYEKPKLGSINAKQLAKKMRRIGFDLNELLISTQELDAHLQWRRIWRPYGPKTRMT